MRKESAGAEPGNSKSGGCNSCCKRHLVTEARQARGEHASSHW